MSDIMLQGVLRMPPELWQDTALDKMQRHGRYLQAAKELDSLTRQIAEAIKQRDTSQALLTENQHMHGIEIAGYEAKIKWLERENADNKDNLKVAYAERDALKVDAGKLPDVLFDGHAVYKALDERAVLRTGPENVSDTLDAVVRIMCGETK